VALQDKPLPLIQNKSSTTRPLYTENQVFTSLNALLPDSLLEFAKALCGVLILQKNNINVKVNMKISNGELESLVENVFQKNESIFNSTCDLHPKKIITKLLDVDELPWDVKTMKIFDVNTRTRCVYVSAICTLVLVNVISNVAAIAYPCVYPCKQIKVNQLKKFAERVFAHYILSFSELPEDIFQCTRWDSAKMSSNPIKTVEVTCQEVNAIKTSKYKDENVLYAINNDHQEVLIAHTYWYIAILATLSSPALKICIQIG
jgi:hypothetical protein